MIIYINIFFTILFSFLFAKSKISNEVKLLSYGIVFLLFTLFIGLRYKVGGDWDAYLEHFRHLEFQYFFDNLLNWDPGYVLLEYISLYLGLDIYGVNTLCAIIFLFSFFYFIKTFNIKLPYALLVSYPYLIMVVVNGYTRQGVAVGIGMLFMGFLYKKELPKTIICLILAVLFHKSAIVLALFYLLEIKLSIKKLIIIGGVIAGILFLMYIIFQAKIQSMYTHYIEKQMHSVGAIIRISVNVLAGVLLIAFFKQYKKIYDDYDINILTFFISLIAFLLATVARITTVSDRLLLYFYPFQIIVFPRILYIINRINKYLGFIYFIFLILLFSGVLFVWLFFAAHRYAWLPYDNLLFHLE